MCLLPKAPEMPKITTPPTPPVLKKQESRQVTRGMDAERRRRLAAYGREDTVATSSRGLLAPAPVKKKKLLGE